MVTRRGPQEWPQLEAYELQSNLSTTSYPIAPSEFPKRWSTERVPGCYPVASINIHPSSGEYNYPVNAQKAATKQNTPQRICDKVIARSQQSKDPKVAWLLQQPPGLQLPLRADTVPGYGLIMCRSKQQGKTKHLGVCRPELT